MRNVKKHKSSCIVKIFTALVMIAAAAAAGAVCAFFYTGGLTGDTGADSYEQIEADTADVKEDEDAVEDILGSMTLEEKVNQLFFVTPEALTGEEAVTAAGEETKAALSTHPVGGIVLFSGNITGEKQLKELISGCKTAAAEVCRLPLFIGVDEEGGTVARLGNSEEIDVPKLPNMSEIGASADSEKAYNAGSALGEYLSEYGFNLDFAPVADVLTNSENEVVKYRSFGSDPKAVAEMAVQLAKGLNDRGVAACYKHFPGHGATAGDTHEGYAYTDKTYSELKEAELVPFAEAIENNAEFIMVGHISLPNIIGDNTPASLSSVIINDILKNDMGYEGIVITDSLSMGALTNSYSAEEIALKAVEAGADMLLMPSDFEAAYSAVLNAAESGVITEERIDESVRKIISLKLKM